MQEQIYTIPINESFEAGVGCPFCRLHAAAREKAIAYITGAAMMEPAVRQETNRRGFCRVHLSELLGRKNRLSVALMLESHLDALEKACFADTKGLLSRANDPAKTAAVLADAERSCFICGRIEEWMGHYFANTVYLWKSEPAFRRLFAAQEAFCVPHLRRLLEQGAKGLSRREAPAFSQEAIDVARRHHAALRANLALFTRSFDYRFAEEGKEEHVKNAVENVAAYLTGAD